MQFFVMSHFRFFERHSTHCPIDNVGGSKQFLEKCKAKVSNLTFCLFCRFETLICFPLSKCTKYAEDTHCFNYVSEPEI